MQKLQTELKVQNRTLKQLKREGRVAIYELFGANGMPYGFEVIIVKIHPAEIIRGRDYPEREGYPANEDWGDLAWSYGRNQRKEALECFDNCLTRTSGSSPEIDLVPETQNLPASDSSDV
jgi:hypothetical protein